MTWRHLARAALLGTALLAVAGSARASNGPMPQTVGTKGPVSIPIDGDAQTMFRMPSSIAWSLDHRVDLDAFWFYSVAHMRNSLNDYERSGATLGGSGGILLALGRPDFEADAEAAEAYTDARKLTVGFGIYPEMAGGGGKRSFVRYETFPEKVGTRKAILFVSSTVTVAYTVTDWFAAGLGLSAIYADLSLRSTVGGSSTSLNGSPQINSVNFPGNPTYADFLALFSSDSASDPSTLFASDLTSVQFAATISISLRLRDNLGFGFSYRPRSWDPLHFTGDAEVDAGRTITQLDATTQTLLLATLPGGGNEFTAGDYTGKYDAELYGIRVPRQVRANVVWWPVDWLLLSAEVAWIEWHRAFRQVNVRLEKGDNGDLNFVVGSNALHSVIANRWSNHWVGAFYAAASVNEWLTLRAGVVHGKSPFNEGLAGNNPNSGISETMLCLGGGLRWQLSGGQVLEANLLVEHSFHSQDRSGARPEEKTAKYTYFSAQQWFVHLGFGLSF